MADPRVSVIIVSWNVRDYLRRCVRSLLNQAQDVPLEVIVSDNDSHDGSAETIEVEFPSVLVQRNGRNLGYAGGVNRGAARARAPYLLILNSDCEVTSDGLSPLVDFLDRHPDYGAVGPRLLNTDGTHQPSTRRFPTLREVLRRFTLMGLVLRKSREVDDPLHPRDVEQVSGAALCVRRDLFERLQGMDEGYFFYYEDVDFCRRLWNEGRRIRYLPEAVFTHHRGKSRHQAYEELNLVYLRSLVRYMRRHRVPRGSGILLGLFKIVFVLNLFYAVFRDSIGFFVDCRRAEGSGRANRRWARLRTSVLLMTRDLPVFLGL